MSRRVKKGQGRRPKSLARRRFVELLAQGWSVRAACRELGISRSAGNRWKNSARVKLKDGTVKVVPPLEPLATRQISARFLSEEERVRIADLATRGAGPTEIARVLRGHRPRSVGSCAGTCTLRGPFHAHSPAAARRRRLRPLHGFVTALLRERWSPQQISRALRRAHPDVPPMRLAPDSIYEALYRPGSGLLGQTQPSPLRTGRDHWRGQTHQLRARDASPSRCCRSTSVASTPRTARWPATGKGTSSSAHTTAPPSLPSSSERPATSNSSTFLCTTPRRCRLRW